jgi:hypothetical protein
VIESLSRFVKIFDENQPCFARKGRKWPKSVQRDFGEGRKTVAPIGKIGVQPVCNAGVFKLIQAYSRKFVNAQKSYINTGFLAF